MMEEKPKRKQGWNDRRKKHVPKPITTKSEQGEIKSYFASEEELAYYRSLKPPVPERQLRTLAPQVRTHVNFRNVRE